MPDASLLAAVDWRQPWLAPYRDRGEALTAALHETGHAAEALNRVGTSCQPRFVAADRLPAGEPYESFIGASGTIPTRDNLHDLCNGLVWLAFPLAKRRLNALQAQAIGTAGVGTARGPLRDAITVFDENGALLQAPPALVDALAARNWQRLFVELRPLWRDARLTLFGHALLEKLTCPRKAITAHALVLPGPAGTLPKLDAALAAQLDAATLATKPFLPLPVLGVPGWWPGNADRAFYDDAAVFRPARRRPA